MPWDFLGGPVVENLPSDAGLGALSVAVHAWDLLKDVAIIFITSIIVCVCVCVSCSVVSNCL